MAKNERYITVVELNSQQAMDRLKELEKKVNDLKKAKEEAAKTGGFFDESSLKKATKELNQWRAQITGVQGILDNINDVTLEDLQKGLRKLKAQSKTALPGTQEFTDIQNGIIKIEDRIKELRNATREAKTESEQLRENMQLLTKVMQNVKGASLNELLSAQKILESNVANAKPGSTSYDTSIAQLKEVKTRIQEIKAEQSQIIRQIDKYDQEIKVASKDMATMERETDLVDKTLRNLSKANMRDLEFSIKIVNEQLREMPRGTKEFEKMQERAKLLRTELEKVRFEGAAQQSWLNRTADFFNKIQGAAIAGISAITGLTFTIRKCVNAFADMDQEQENVRKYTGQTSEQVHEMNEEFKKMDTRTAREKLNQLAGDAGRLGIQGKQAIMEFVEGADIINVALGDDLGENAVRNIGKLAMSFGTDKNMGLRGAMLATASAVNELSQNSSASGSYLVDFTARVAGFGKQVGLTQTQIMGFGAVMDENMLRDEMAATAFGQLLVKMTTDLDTFANITGMKVEEYKKLVTEDINGAILAVARSLKGRDMQDLGKVFDAMNLDGQRAIGVLATLGQKVDDVADRQKIANKAFEEGSSVISEYNIQNKTIQAQLEKQKKKFLDLSIALGEKLLPLARYTITTGALLVKVIMTLIEFVGKYRTTIILLTVTMAGYVVLKEKDVVISKLQVFWNEKVVVSAKKLWAVLIANPYAAVAAAIAVVIGMMIDYSRRNDSVSEGIKRLNKVRDEAKKKVIEEKDSIDLLIKASKNDKLALDDRLKAISKLQEQIPGYITELDKETGRYKENKKALDDYLKSLQKKYELEGAKDMLADIGKEIAAATVKLNQAKKAVEDAEKAGGGTSYTTSYGAVGNTSSDLQDRTRREMDMANIELQNKLNVRKQILQAYGLELQEEAANAQEQEEEVVTPEPFKDPKADDKARKAAEAAAKKEDARKKKELQEKNNALKAETEAELAIVMQRYAKGEIDYRTYVAEINRIQLEGFNKRMAIYEEESDEYKKLLNDREQFALKALEKQERLNLRAVEREHNEVITGIERSFYNPESSNYMNEGATNEAQYQADIEYLQKKAALYRKGSEERALIEDEIEDRERLHKLENEHRYFEMLQQVREQYLLMSNEQQLQIALNGLDELHKQGLLKEDEYQRALMAVRAQYSTSITPAEQNQKSGGDALKVASDNARESLGDNVHLPYVGAVQQYQATMEQLKQMYASDEINYETYQEAKRQATVQLCQDLASQFQAAYNSINQLMSAASSLYSAQADYETAVVKKKYEKQIAAAGNNQKKVKKLQEKQAKEEADIKTKYNKKAVKIQIAQAIASTALSAVNAYASAAQVPFIGYILAPIAAAAALAAGMIQVAAIKKQAEAQEAGYYSGGYTGGKRYRKEAGVVHEGEFVANHQAVNNPSVRPVLDFIDKAQKNNTVGSLTADDISRQLGGGGTVVTPVVNINNDNEELKEELKRNREVNEKLNDILENDGINLNFPLDSFDDSYTHFKNLRKR